MPETIDGRLGHLLFAIRHTPYAFLGLDFSRRIPRRAAFCILRAVELSSLGECYNVRVYTDGSTARKRESTWHVP